MNLKHFPVLVFSAIGCTASLLLGGCSSPQRGAIANSLETVSGGYENQGAWKLEQIRGTSINGLMPFQTVGDVFHYKPARGALGAFGLSDDGKTYVATRNFLYNEAGKKTNDAEATTTITAITRNLRELALNGAESVVKNIDLATLKSELAELEQKQSTETDTAKRTVIDNDINQTKVKISAIEKVISGLDVKKATAESDLNTALAKPNVIIARWATDDKKSGSVQAGTIASFSGSRNESFKGFVILAGFQVQNIVIGDDLFTALKNQTKNINLGHDYTDWISSSVGSRVHVVTSLLKADHIAYLGERDLVSEMKLHLRIKASEMQNGAAWLKNLDEIVADYAATLGQSYSNTGYIRQTGNVTRRTLEAEKTHQRTNAEANQSTVMSVTTEVRDLIKIYKTTSLDRHE